MATRARGGSRRSDKRARDARPARPARRHDELVAARSIAGVGAFVTATATVFLALTRAPNYGGADVEPGALVFPGAAALSAGLAAWLLTQRAALALPPGGRVACALAALAFAVVAAVALVRTVSG